ncbi:Predicted membrane protein [Paenibacillus algorifonticola]|uniref:Predicted membrane protein n=1 Tax=Paenibacillus algorifonticola TaxID=684063 RepID=A0A1I2DI37_9BACL|nr:DUF2157 domain-containing protein [Paenibacillus algorifonticola]SFE80098.1 Predicted membrane protein [Paenibacillus algorifonticola]
MLRVNMIRMGFLMGIALLLAAIFYLFAANWDGLSSSHKMLTSAGFVLFFYVLSFGFSRSKLPLGLTGFLSGIFLVAGCIAFGAAAALADQIYNLQQPPYVICLISLLPSLMLAWITRYKPLYVLTYILAHFTLYFLFDYRLFTPNVEMNTLLADSTFAAFNLALFLLAQTKRLASEIVRLASFVMLHISLLNLAGAFDHAGLSLFMNALDIAVIAACFYYFMRIRLDKTMLTLTALAASAYTVAKFIRFSLETESVFRFVLGIVFVIVLLTANVLFFRYMNKLGNKASTAERNTEDYKESAVEAAAQPVNGAASRTTDHHLLGSIVSTIITIVGIIIGSISVIGLVVLLTDENGPIKTQYALYALSLLFIVPMLLLPRVNAVVRYTVFTVGFAMGLVSIAWIEKTPLSIIFLAIAIISWLRLQGRMQHLITYMLMNIAAAIVLYQLFQNMHDAYSSIIISLTVLNAAAYGSSYVGTNGERRIHLREGSLLFSFIFLLWVTSLDPVFAYSVALFNVLAFILLTAAVFLFIKREQMLETAGSFFFWLLFLAIKYYDYLWTLLNKSVTLALLGIIALGLSYWFARRLLKGGNHYEGSGKIDFFVGKSVWLIAAVVLLQLGFIGYQTAANERLPSRNNHASALAAPANDAVSVVTISAVRSSGSYMSYS